MVGLNGFLADLEAKKTEVENQDIEAYVQAKLAEIAPKIRAEAEQSQAYEAKVLEIKIEAIKEALEIVAAQTSVENNLTHTEESIAINGEN